MLRNIHFHRQGFFQWSIGIATQSVTVLPSTHHKSTSKVTYKRLKYLHPRNSQRYRRYINQYNTTIGCQAIKGRWYVIGSPNRNVYFRSLKRRDNIVSLTGSTLDHEHTRRALHIDERGCDIVC